MASLPFQVRPFRKEDTDACLALFDANAAGVTLPLEKREFLRFITTLPHSGYGAVFTSKSGEVVAFGGAMLRVAGEAALCWGVVSPQRHGQGIAEALRVHRMAFLCGLEGLTRVTLDTNPTGEESLKTQGFRTFATQVDSYGPGLPRVRLEMKLDDDRRKEILAQAEKLGIN